MKKVFALFFLVFVSITLSACVPKIGTNVKAPPTGEFVKGAIVSGFPDNLPLSEGAEVVESYGSSEAFGALFVVDKDLVRVVNFYNDALPKLGWQSTLSKQSETNYQFGIKNDTYVGVVIVNTASDGEKTAITMSVELR